MARKSPIFHAEAEVETLQKLLLGLDEHASGDDLKRAIAAAGPGKVGHGMKAGQWDADMNSAFTDWVIARQTEYGIRKDGWVGAETLGALKGKNERAFQALNSLNESGKLDALHSRTTAHPPKGQELSRQQAAAIQEKADKGLLTGTAPVHAAPSKTVVLQAPPGEGGKGDLGVPVVAAVAAGVVTVPVAKHLADAARNTRETKTVSELRQNLRNDAIKTGTAPAAASPAGSSSTAVVPAARSAASQAKEGVPLPKDDLAGLNAKTVKGVTVETTGPARPPAVFEPPPTTAPKAAAAAAGVATEDASLMSKAASTPKLPVSRLMGSLAVVSLAVDPALAAADAPEGQRVDAAVKAMTTSDYILATTALGIGFVSGGAGLAAGAGLTLKAAWDQGKIDYQQTKKKLGETLAPYDQRQDTLVVDASRRLSGLATQVALAAGKPAGTVADISDMLRSPEVFDKVYTHYQSRIDNAVKVGDEKAAKEASLGMALLQDFGTVQTARTVAENQFKNDRDPHRAMATAPVPVF